MTDATDDASEGDGLGIILLVVLIDMLGFSLVIPFLTYFIQDLASGSGFEGPSIDLWVGVTFGAYSLAQFLFAPLLGALSDRLGRRPIMMFGMVSNSVFFVMFGITGNLWVALIARFLAGAGNGTVAVARASIGDISTPSQMPKRMGLIGASFGLGFLIGPVIGGFLSDPATSMPWAFSGAWWVAHPYALPCLFSAFLSLIAFLISVRRLPETLPVEDRLHGSTGSPLTMAMRSTWSNLTGWLTLPVGLRRLVLVNFVYTAGFSAMTATFVLLTGLLPSEGGLGFDARQNGYVFTFVGFMGIVVQGGLIGPLSKRFGPRRLLLAGLLTAGLGLASIPYVRPGYVLLGFAVVLVLISLGNGLVLPTSGALVASECRANNRVLGQDMGIYEGYGALSRVIGPLLGAVIWTQTAQNEGVFDQRTVFWICGALALCAFLLLKQTTLRSEALPAEAGSEVRGPSEDAVAS